jgi:transcriptional regulator with XRE-family HTH domain
MRDEATDVNLRIAERVRDLRADRALTLEALATRSGVSRSMLSLIERGESSPTAVILEKVASGLGVALASLFERAGPTAGPLSRLAHQPVWRDPESGYVRRNVSPSGVGSPLQIVEVSFPPQARVAYENAARDLLMHQQVWVLDGSIELTVGSVRHRLYSGDCLAMVLDQPIVYRNPTRKTARYAVLVVSQSPSRR